MSPAVDDLRRRFAAAPEVWVATRGPDGAPHVVPRWFVWREDGLFVACDRGSTTWRNAEADPRIAVSVDVGTAWDELAGCTLAGTAELLRAEDPRMRQPISAWHEKYRNLLLGEGFERLTRAIERLGFLRLGPPEELSVGAWDHGAASDRP